MLDNIVFSLLILNKTAAVTQAVLYYSSMLSGKGEKYTKINDKVYTFYTNVGIVLVASRLFCQILNCIFRFLWQCDNISWFNSLDWKTKYSHEQFLIRFSRKFAILQYVSMLYYHHNIKIHKYIDQNNKQNFQSWNVLKAG